MFLTDDLQRKCDAEGKHAGVYQRHPAGKDVGQEGVFRDHHDRSGQKTAYKTLDAVQPQAVQIACHTVHQGDLNRVTQRAAQQIKITDVYLRNTDAAEQIQTCNGHHDADPSGNGRFFLQEDAQYRNQHNVHGGNESGFSCGGVDDTHLLQTGSDEEGNTAGDAGFPQLRRKPLFNKIAAISFQHKNDQNQKGNCKDGAHGLECKRTDIVHAHTLGNKSGAPDDRGDQQGKTSAKFVFHNNHQGRI